MCSDVLWFVGLRHPYPSFYMPKGVGFIRKIWVGYNIPYWNSISTCLFYKNYLLDIFQTASVMGLLVWIFRSSEPTHGGPPFPSLWVQSVGYPWYQTSSVAPKSLASELRSWKSKSSLLWWNCRVLYLSRIIGRVPKNVVRVLLSQFDANRCTY
jgi:hypothetical protein